MIGQESVYNEVEIQIMRQNNEAVRLVQNYERYGTIEDLNKAVSMMEQVIEMTSRESISLGGKLGNFGAMLRKRFERTGLMDDLNRAVEVANMAVDATPQDHP